MHNHKEPTYALLGACEDDISLNENHLGSKQHTIPSSWNDFWLVLLAQDTYIYLSNINYTEILVHLSELLHHTE